MTPDDLHFEAGINPFDPEAPDSEAELQALAHALSMSQGFKLVFARCNSPAQRNQLTARLGEMTKRPVLNVSLPRDVSNLLDELAARVPVGQQDPVSVTGAEQAAPTPPDPDAPVPPTTQAFLAKLNSARNSFPVVLNCPVLLWMPEYLLRLVATHAPDFFSIRSGTFYFVQQPQLIVREGLEVALESRHAETLSSIEAEERIQTLRNLISDSQSRQPDLRNRWAEAMMDARLGELLMAHGRISEARPCLRNAVSKFERLLADRPDSINAARGLARAYILLGDVEMLGGDTESAILSYQTAVRVRANLADAAPYNTQWQRDLSVSHQKLGDVAVATGKLDDAALAYADCLAIAMKLADLEPSNAHRQRDLSVSYNRLGNMAVARGKLDDAARSYADGLAIAKKLATSDSSNNLWQRDLSVSYNTLGNVSMAQGKLDDAARAYNSSFSIVKKLATSDPSNTQWQRDLSVSYEKLGIIAMAQGKLDTAARAYADSLAIRQKLAASDPSNIQWQRDLWVAFGYLAMTKENQADPGAARLYWQQAFEVLSGLEKRGLHLSPQDRAYLASLREKLAAP